MPGPFVAHIFLSQSATGWTETWYPLGADIAETALNADKISTASMGLKPDLVKCEVIKVSDLTVKGDVFWTFPTTQFGTYVPNPVVPTHCLDCNNAMKYVLLGADPKHRSIHYMRGLPSNICDMDQPATIAVDQVFAVNQAALLTELKRSAQLVFPDKQNPGKFLVTGINSAIYPAQNATYKLSVRRSGRPFGLRRGRQPV